jgi:HSP20 family protein
MVKNWIVGSGEWRASSPEDDRWQAEGERIFGWMVRHRSHLWRPPTDVCETEAAFVVMVEVAGMRESEFSVTMEGQVLTIRGVRSDATGPKAYHQMEIAFGEFVTEVQVNAPVDIPQIEAGYTDGFLRVVLPKAQPKRVVISS